MLSSVKRCTNSAGESVNLGSACEASRATTMPILWRFYVAFVKVMGYLRCIREAVPHLIARGGGRIVNISGLAARSTGSTVGSIRNVAVAAMTKNLADELGRHGISVVVVHPAL